MEKEILGSFFPEGEVYIEKWSLGNERKWRAVSTCPWFKYTSAVYTQEKDGVISEQCEKTVRQIGNNILKTAQRKQTDKSLVKREGYGDW